MRFTKGSVQRLAAGALISLQAKLLVVEDIFTSAQAAPADDDAVNSLFVHHARITVDDDGKKAKKGTTSASMAPTMSSSIAPLPNNAIVPPFQKTTADIGILVPAVPSRRSSITADDERKKNTRTPSSGSTTTSSRPPLQSAMPFQHRQAADAGNLFSSHVSTKGKETDEIKTRSIPPLLPRATAPTSYQMTDTGVLFSSENNESTSTPEGKINIEEEPALTPSSVVTLLPPTSMAMMMSSSSEQVMMCEHGYVDCWDGWTDWVYQGNGVWESSTTCRDACNGACCVSNEAYSPGYRACDHFTGKVCKDGSCSGYFACYLVDIPLVVNSCIGYGACCEKFGYEGKVSNSVINSCQGNFACQLIGGRFKEDGGGAVDNVIDSCIGDGACTGLGLFGSFSGDVINSCKGYNACFDLGYNGTIQGLSHSCNNDYACVLMADDGSVNNVDRSCNANGACQAAGSMFCVESDENHGCLMYDGGGIDSLIDCCNANDACQDITEANLAELCVAAPPPTATVSDVISSVLAGSDGCWIPLFFSFSPTFFPLSENLARLRNRKNCGNETIMDVLSRSRCINIVLGDHFANNTALFCSHSN